MGLSVPESFRRSMGWLHTWLGIALASVLFAVFWTGTLTVFDKEIDQWMRPELRIANSTSAVLDRVALPRLAQLQLQPGSLVWVGPPRERIPVVRLFYDDASGQSHEEWLHPVSGEVLKLTDSDAGEFFFRFHFMLHLPGSLGYYIVGLAAVGMMVLVVSGVFVHRKFFREFFTFRPDKQLRRSSLDLHNVTAVVALPFHFMIPFTGLLILAATYFPWSMAVPFKGDLRQLQRDQLAFENSIIEPAGEPGPPIASLDHFVARANALWRAQEGETSSEPDWVAIFNVNDARTYLVVERYFADRRVALGPDQIVFDPRSDTVIDQFAPLPVHAASHWLEGLHWIQFDHWTLRWLYFLAGLSGCVMIGTGLVFWMQARIRKAQPDPFSVRCVRAISVASITGVILASGAFLIANRLLPDPLELQGIHRHDLEIRVFFLGWLLALVHACVRGRAAWAEQCWAIAVTATLAAILNWITTGDHPLAALGRGVGVIAMMDALLLATAVLAGWVALRLRRLPATVVGPAAEEVP